MPKEQFDFSKPDEEGGDQGQFNALPKEANDTLIEKAHGKALEGKGSTERTLLAEKYGLSEELKQLILDGVVWVKNLPSVYGDGETESYDVQLSEVIPEEQMVELVERLPISSINRYDHSGSALFWPSIVEKLLEKSPKARITKRDAYN